MPRCRRFFGVSGLRGKNNSKNNSTLSKKTIVKTIVDFEKNNSSLAALYNINIKRIKIESKNQKRDTRLRRFAFMSSKVQSSQSSPSPIADKTEARLRAIRTPRFAAEIPPLAYRRENTVIWRLALVPYNDILEPRNGVRTRISRRYSEGRRICRNEAVERRRLTAKSPLRSPRLSAWVRNRDETRKAFV